MRKDIFFLILSWIVSVYARNGIDPSVLQKLLKTKEGFKIEPFATNDEWYPRSMDYNPKSGILYLASFGFVNISTVSPAPTRVYAVRISADYSKAEKIIPVTEPMAVPNGVAFHNGSLYVAQMDAIWRYPDVEAHLADNKTVTPELILGPNFLPNNPWHGWRYIRISPSPENKMYIAIGSPCNVPCNDDCNCTDQSKYPYGNILQMNLNGTNIVRYAKGIRNSVGISWHPLTGEMWFTDNGRDDWNPGHDDRPPDELNRVTAPGLDYGFPHCFGKNLSDFQFNPTNSCTPYVGSTIDIVAHAAAIGFRFYTGSMFPSKYKNQVFIAEHGSWDKKPPSGYRVTLVTFEKANNSIPQMYEPFIEGWIINQTCTNNTHCPFASSCQTDQGTPPYFCGGWGRPADIQQLNDGSILISDETSGIIWRVSYSSPRPLTWLWILLGAIGGVVLISVIAVAVLKRKRHLYQEITHDKY